MAKKIQKKGLALGEGKPLVCVPVTERGQGEILSEIQYLTKCGVDMIEWRLDWYEDAEDIGSVVGLLHEMEPMLSHTPLLFTFRSKKQGGQRELGTEEIMAINEAAAQTGVPDLIDVEYFLYDRPSKIIGKLQRHGVGVVTSHHDFEETPNPGVLGMLLEKMHTGGADVVKLAVMPNDHQDVLNLLSATEHFKERHPETPVITMSMGRLGVISRLCGEVFGSCVTFGSHEKPSAPGQMQMDDLALVLEKIHKSILEKS